MITYRACWGVEPLPIDDETCELVFASHVLEHVPWNRTKQALAEVYRILVSGGIFEVWVPNFGYIVECYHDNLCGDDWRRDNPNSCPMLWVNGRLFTYGPGDENWHRSCFDERYLRSCLEEAGFQNVVRLRHRTLGVSHGPIDLGMQGIKP